MKRSQVVVLVALVAASVVVSPAAAGAGLRGWGPRVGLSDDPDQVVVGAHFDLGEVARNVRVQPSVDLGVGDDVVSLSGNAMLGYYFPVKASITPYAGGQVTAAWFDFDSGGENGDRSETEIGLALVGGFETKLRSGTRFLTEIQIGIGDIADMKLLAGWTF